MLKDENVLNVKSEINTITIEIEEIEIETSAYDNCCRIVQFD